MVSNLATYLNAYRLQPQFINCLKFFVVFLFLF